MKFCSDFAIDLIWHQFGLLWNLLFVTLTCTMKSTSDGKFNTGELTVFLGPEKVYVVYSWLKHITPMSNLDGDHKTCLDGEKC